MFTYCREVLLSWYFGVAQREWFKATVGQRRPKTIGWPSRCFEHFLVVVGAILKTRYIPVLLSLKMHALAALGGLLEPWLFCQSSYSLI